jgi:hypothetical protein
VGSPCRPCHLRGRSRQVDGAARDDAPARRACSLSPELASPTRTPIQKLRPLIVAAAFAAAQAPAFAQAAPAAPAKPAAAAPAASAAKKDEKKAETNKEEPRKKEKKGGC